MDRFCDYHQEKGHHTNDCHHLRRQLEAALESDKLNHPIKDIPEREEEEGMRSNKKWMDTPITFPPISAKDVSDEPLIVKAKAKLKETQTYLMGFVGEATKPLGKIELKVCFGSDGLCRRTTMKFTVIRATSPYNVILGRTGLRALRAIPSTIHSMMKFPTPRGITTLVTRELPETCKAQLKLLLKDNMDIFAWEPADMTGAPRRIIEHKLNVNTSIEPKRQKRRVLAPEKSEVVTRDGLENVHRFQESELSLSEGFLPPSQHRLQSRVRNGLQIQVFLGCVQRLSPNSDVERRCRENDVLYRPRNLLLHQDSVRIKKYRSNLPAADRLYLPVTNRKKYGGICGWHAHKKVEKASSWVIWYLAKSAEKSLPFFNTLENITKENKHKYKWTIEAKESFQQMKKCIINLPSLTPPSPKETLYAYLVVSKEAVSFVLLTDRKGKQSPIQHVSRALNEAERNYALMEKLALSLVHMTRRLRRYFKAHPVKVITDQPIKQILSKTEASKKLAKYAVKLGVYNITFELRNAVKGQVLADFITGTPDGESPEKYFRTPKITPERDETEEWTLFTDGALSSKKSRAGLVLIGPSSVEHTYALRLTFDSTNSEAEYEALPARLRIAKKINIQKLEAKVDSKLVASQINGKYIASCDNMMKYLAKAKEYIACFKSFSIKNIPRNQNQKADVLSKIASVAFNHLTKEVLVEVLNERAT
ncbi:reverse transcriptase domain-containing protein [Tanacetum coccineum]